MNTATTTAAPVRTFLIPAHNVERLRAEFDRMGRRARKLGALAPVVDVSAEPVYGRKVWNDSGRSAVYLFHAATVAGEAPRVAGWCFVARVEHTTAGNLLTTIAEGVALPERFRTAKPVCEHCNTARRRADTFVLANDAGELRQVGRNCLADFLRSADVEQFAATAELLDAYLRACGGCVDEDEFGCRNRAPDAFPLVDFLASAAECVRLFGYAKSSESEHPTGAVAWERLTNAALGVGQPAGRADPSEEDQARAGAAAAWALAAEGGSDYIHNVRTIAALGAVGMRHANLAASIIVAHTRELARRAERTAPANLDAHFGAVGKREVFTLTVVGVREFESDFGARVLVMLRDADGRSAKWWTGSGPSGELEVGHTYRIKATVKEHGEYRGARETVLTRASVVEEVQAAA